MLAPAAHAGELIDRAASELQQDNVYVDPDADPTLTDDQAQALRERISSQGAGPMYVAVMPAAIAGEAGGSTREAMARIARAVGDPQGTYVLAAGRSIRGGSGSLDEGVTNEIIDAAIEDGGGDLNTILVDVTDQVGEAQANGGSLPGSSFPGGLIILGLLGAGGAAFAVSRRNRRRRDDAEFQQAKANARDDLVALGDDIRALDLDASMPDADPEARADYDHAVARYTEADEQWERARRPAGACARGRSAGGRPLGDGLGEGALRRRGAARAPAALLLRPAPRALDARRRVVAAVRRAAHGPGLRGGCAAPRGGRRPARPARSSGTAAACRTGRPARRTRRSRAGTSAASAAGCSPAC